MELFDYQKSAAYLMMQHNRFGLHDEMGIGKTATTIGAMDLTFAQRGIVICPAMLRENWLREIRMFSKYPRRVCKGKSIHDYVAWSRGRFDIIVASYEQATKWAPKIRDDGEFLDFVAMDEAHYLKNVEANRTRAILGLNASGKDSIVQWAEYAWHITGTPMPNDPMDIYAFLQFAKAIKMEPSEFVRYFMTQRLGTYGAKNSVNPDMLSNLQSLIYSNSLRRTHRDVGLQLPDIWIKELLIEGNTIDLEAATEGYPNLEKIIVEAIETGNIKLLDAQYIAVVRRLVGKAKAVAYAQLLKDELDAGAGKRVVFCWHTEPLLYVRNFLMKYGYKVVVAYGDTPEHERQKAVDAFQKDPDTVVFLGNIRVAGVGLTLTESCEIDMLESDWSPAGNAQAIKRVHRYGQRQTVHGRFITLANSIDVAVNKTVAGKTAAIAQIEGHSMTAAPLDTIH